MEEYKLIAPCHFGLEAVLKREITDLGLSLSEVEDGKVSFKGGAAAIVEANLRLRTTERILLEVGKFEAKTFDELFEKTKALPWESYLPRDAKFWVAKAASVSSALFSPSDIQSIMKKAIVERLKEKYALDWFPEDGAPFPIRVAIRKDIVTVGLDTTGVSLHKRGYRTHTAKAPITETLAAALLLLTPWKPGRILVDPFCGSGTFPIEAAMIAAGMAPGLRRSFLSEEWEHLIDARLWKEARERAEAEVNVHAGEDIQGYDIDPEVIAMARENAKAAGVDSMIHFQKRDVTELSHSGAYGFLITNPPYGERLEERETLPDLYRALGERFAALPTWSMYLITAFEGAQEAIGRPAEKNRKIYNGMMKTYFYQYPGPKPPKRESERAGQAAGAGEPCDTRQEKSAEKEKKMRIIFATGNAHKAREVREILGLAEDELLTMREAGVDIEIEETGTTFRENAIQKAEAVRAALPAGSEDIVLADDSGLEVDAMGKEPGIRSARFLGEDTPHSEKIKEILRRLEGVPEKDRTARFVCAVAAVFPDGSCETVQETMEGRIGEEPRGTGGFGYDPVFYLEGEVRSNGELSAEEKNAVSHRGKAFRRMREILFDKSSPL